MRHAFLNVEGLSFGVCGVLCGVILVVGLASSRAEADSTVSAPAALQVEGYNAASHVAPKGSTERARPVVVVLHGNFDRPEWECETWAHVASAYGWVLCPRGVRSTAATRAEDRWTYRGPAKVEKEIEAALKALEKAYPGRVDRAGTVLAGFSLGAIYAPGLAVSAPGKYPFLFLVEGGLKKLDKNMAKRLEKAGVKGVAMAMSAIGRRSQARKLLPVFEARGLAAVFVDMAGAGHGYRDDFEAEGRKALSQLLDNKTKGTGGDK